MKIDTIKFLNFCTPMASVMRLLVLTKPFAIKLCRLIEVASVLKSTPFAMRVQILPKYLSSSKYKKEQPRFKGRVFCKWDSILFAASIHGVTF